MRQGEIAARLTYAMDLARIPPDSTFLGQDTGSNVIQPIMPPLNVRIRIMCSVPDCLLHLQSVGIRRREGSQARAGRDALLETDVFGVVGEVRGFVDVLDRYGDASCGL